MTTQMGELIGIADVAVMAGWCCKQAKQAEVLCPRGTCKCCHAGYQRARAQLLASNAQVGGMLLVNTAAEGKRPRWRLTREALQRLHPQWFVRERDTEEAVRSLRAELVEVRQLVENAHREIGTLRAELDEARAALRNLLRLAAGKA